MSNLEISKYEIGSSNQRDEKRPEIGAFSISYTPYCGMYEESESFVGHLLNLSSNLIYAAFLIRSIEADIQNIINGSSL